MALLMTPEEKARLVAVTPPGPPFYLSEDQDREYGHFRVVDRRKQKDPKYPRADGVEPLYWLEHVVCMCDDPLNAEVICGLLNRGHRRAGGGS